MTVRRASLVVVSALLHVAAHAALRLATVRLVDRAATALGAAVRLRGLDVPTVAWAVTAAARRVGGTCLTQALVARVLLAWSGRASRLVIGVRPGLSCPEFHAWADSAAGAIPALGPAHGYEALLIGGALAAE